MALCVPDLCTGLLSVLALKPTQVLRQRLQRGPSCAHLKLNTADCHVPPLTLQDADFHLPFLIFQTNKIRFVDEAKSVDF